MKTLNGTVFLETKDIRKALNIGNLKEYENALFLTLGTGIGGAFYYKNELIVPNTYSGMEIGHMVIEVNGKKCRCGKNGCFEEYASMRAFRNRIREIYNIEDVNSSIALDLFHKKDFPAKKIGKSWLVMEEAFKDYFKNLGNANN